MPSGPNVGYIRPEVEAQLDKWQLVDDAVEGIDAIKKAGTKYLIRPESYTDQQYANYLQRAGFFPVTGRTLEGLVGQVYSEPVVTDLDSSLDPLVLDVDGAGLTLEQQSKMTLSNVLKKGRAGLLSDFPDVPDDMVVTQADRDEGGYRPRVILYAAEQIINWREMVKGGKTSLSLLVLKEETIIEDDGFEFETEPRWRVYEIDESGFVMVTVYKLDDSDEYEIETQTQITGSDGVPLTEIPFTFVGSLNNDSTVDESPLFPIASLNIGHYRNDADNEQCLNFMSQKTIVITGVSETWMEKYLKGGVKMGSQYGLVLGQHGDAKLLEPKSDSRLMDNMEHKEDQMKAIGAKLIEPKTVQRTATETEIEATSEASMLSSVAQNVSTAYKTAFYHCSKFGEDVDPETIIIELNSEFQVMGLNAQERAEVVSAWMNGLITKEEARAVYKAKGIATENDEEAFVKIAGEGVEFA